MGDTSTMLRLVAQDEDDLAVLSAHMQDAQLSMGDMTFQARARRFALVAQRFDWTRPDDPHRRLTGMHFEGVLAAKRLGLPAADDTVPMNLLAMTFEAGDPPGGEITLHFSGDAAIRLIVECIEAQLRDLGPEWEATCCPSHALDDKEAPATAAARAEG